MGDDAPRPELKNEMIVASRLSDPDNLLTDNPRLFMELSDKIAGCITQMIRQPQNGGNPFMFIYCSPKPHVLASKKEGGMNIETAATDGHKYYWNPDFLAIQSSEGCMQIMYHETYHDCFQHCSGQRFAGMDKAIVGIAVDFVVNSSVENMYTKVEKLIEERKLPPPAKPLPKFKWQIKHTEKDFLEPISLKQYLDWIDGKIKDLPKKVLFSDPETCLEMSPENIYDKIRFHIANSPRRCKECSSLSMDPDTGLSTIPLPWGDDCCQSCGAPPGDGTGGFGSLDSHMENQKNRDEIVADMMRAAEGANAISASGRGFVPSEIEEMLGLLQNPELSPRDMIRMAMASRVRDAGFNNDWSRFRRRPEYIYIKVDGKFVPKYRIFRPKKYDYTPKWVAMIDTSGSMGDDDIANGCKEVQVVASLGEGWIVPCDATPHWDAAVKITNKTDVKRTRIVGRGGTVFDDFFRDLPKQKFWSGNMDLIIIITDGDCGQVPVNLVPAGCDVLWIVTNKREFHPNFGRVVQLNPVRHLSGISTKDPPYLDEVWGICCFYIREVATTLRYFNHEDCHLAQERIRLF